MSHGYEGDLTPTEAWELLENHDDAVLVDVRSQQEWDETGVPDLSTLRRRVVLASVQGPFGWNPTFLEELATAGLTPGGDRPVVFLCRVGGRSQAAAQIATAAGLGPAYNVVEGVEGMTSAGAGWLGSGLPVTSPELAAAGAEREATPRERILSGDNQDDGRAEDGASQDDGRYDGEGDQSAVVVADDEGES